MSSEPSKQSPQHLSFLTLNAIGLRWDWRKENPAEVVLVVFALIFFLLFPRYGCGITPISQQSLSQNQTTNPNKGPVFKTPKTRQKKGNAPQG